LKRISKIIRSIKEEKDNFKTRWSASSLEITIFRSIDSVPEEEWNKAVPEARGLMRHPYLRAIEYTLEDNDQSRYVLIRKRGEPVAAAIIHIVLISGEDYRISSVGQSKLKKLTTSVKDKAKVRVLVCGHTHISGNHGFVYSSSISSEEAYHALADACYQIRQQGSSQGKVSLNLIKDFYDDEVNATRYLKVFKYRQFKVDPNMILKIRPEWTCLDDYLNAMSSKYRKNAQSVINKGASLERRSLTEEEIRSNIDQIQALYLNVANKAKVRINHFDASYLFQLKQNLKDGFELIAYFFDNEMVAFSTLIFWGDNCEAHALGINYEFNTQLAIYQNILYDDVKRAIAAGKSNLILGRTAMEMKSNIGAEPSEMYCYIRHSGPVLNRICKPVFNYIKQTPWQQRNPFKGKSN